MTRSSKTTQNKSNKTEFIMGYINLVYPINPKWVTCVFFCWGYLIHEGLKGHICFLCTSFY